MNRLSLKPQLPVILLIAVITSLLLSGVEYMNHLEIVNKPAYPIIGVYALGIFTYLIIGSNRIEDNSKIFGTLALGTFTLFMTTSLISILIISNLNPEVSEISLGYLTFAIPTLALIGVIISISLALIFKVGHTLKLKNG